jgi:flagellar biosynthetic protein FliP
MQPLAAQQITTDEALTRAESPIKKFMAAHTRNEDLSLFVNMAQAPQPQTVEGAPLQAIVPAFMLSELKRAFEIGFLLFVPFLIIDMAVASILMSMGMMMLPPIVISLPFKLIFFVLVDGWRLVADDLARRKRFGEIDRSLPLLDLKAVEPFAETGTAVTGPRR